MGHFDALSGASCYYEALVMNSGAWWRGVHCGKLGSRIGASDDNGV